MVYEALFELTFFSATNNPKLGLLPGETQKLVTPSNLNFSAIPAEKFLGSNT